MKYLATDQMQALERHACENYPITLEQMMQNAGKAVFDVVINEIIPQITEGEDHNPRILCVVGKGNNGGDALVTARLLNEKGHVGAGQSHGANKTVTVLSPYPDEEFSLMAKKEMEKIVKIGIKITNQKSQIRNYDLIIDALFGFSLKGNPRPPADKIIEQIICSRTPVLSVDVPSGLDVHDGSIGQPTIKADYTVALGMLKKGFKEHPDIVGKIYLGDLGIPEQAYRDMGYEYPLFRGKSYISVN